MANAIFPKLHNAAWPGVVGKGEGSEPPIGLDTMLELTAAAEVNGQRFDGVDLFLFDPHVSIDSTDAQLEDAGRRRFAATGWSSVRSSRRFGRRRAAVRRWAMMRRASSFSRKCAKGCRIARTLRQLGIRPYGVVRIDSACSPSEWAADPKANTQRIADTFRRACDIAEEFGERLAAEGEICWGGMHSARHMVELLEAVNRPQTLGFQADMAHTLLFMMGHNAPEDRLVADDFQWEDTSCIRGGLQAADRHAAPLDD